MNNLYGPKNMEVTHAGYKYVGHYRRGYLEIILQSPGCGVSVNPSDPFSMYDLFSVFGIDAEDGVWMEKLVGRYCRVHFDKEGYVEKLQHITNDNIVWYSERGKKDESGTNVN